MIKQDISPAYIKRRKVTKKILSVLKWIVLLCGSFVMLYPLIFMILVGFFTKEEYWRTTLTLFPFPKNPYFRNFIALFNPNYVNEILHPAILTLIITVATTVCTVITVLFCSYAFGRLRWKGQFALLFALMATGMLPTTMGLIPQYLMYSQMRLINTYAVYFIGLPGINIMATFLVTQYFLTIPKSFDESAKIDGANLLQIMFRIVLPMAKPIFGYIIITTAIGAWNNWNTGFFFTDRLELRTLPAVLSSLALSGNGIPDYPFMVTLGLLITIPTLLIYLFFQKYIVQGLVSSGIKG